MIPEQQNPRKTEETNGTDSLNGDTSQPTMQQNQSNTPETPPMRDSGDGDRSKKNKTTMIIIIAFAVILAITSGIYFFTQKDSTIETDSITETVDVSTATMLTNLVASVKNESNYLAEYDDSQHDIFAYDKGSDMAFVIANKTPDYNFHHSSRDTAKQSDISQEQVHSEMFVVAQYLEQGLTSNGYLYESGPGFTYDSRPYVNQSRYIKNDSHCNLILRENVILLDCYTDDEYKTALATYVQLYDIFNPLVPNAAVGSQRVTDGRRGAYYFFPDLAYVESVGNGLETYRVGRSSYYIDDMRLSAEPTWTGGIQHNFYRNIQTDNEWKYSHSDGQDFALCSDFTLLDQQKAFHDTGCHSDYSGTSEATTVGEYYGIN